ncbi:MAG TPA: response regulator [Bryobacteraceae bacterium]|nr:response regulator [Bryobacteraceae bacterium]
MARRHVVLVAEDDALVRELINSVLLREGYSVLLASDGVEALELSRGYSGDIHLLLSDVIMPRMNGVNLAANIRAERPATRSLLMSGELGTEITRPSREVDFLRKPFVPEELRRKLREILDPAPD